MVPEERLKQVEERVGKPIILRGVRDPDPLWRGRITQRPSHILLEYRDDVVGFFWHHDIIRELLDLLEQGQTDVTLRDES